MCNYRIKSRDERRITQEFLYWFTHQELRPVHLTPRCNPLNTDTINYRHTAVLEPFKNLNNKGWKTLFQLTLHSKKPYVEWLTLKTNTRIIRKRLHLKQCCKNINQLFYLLQDNTSTFIQHKVLQEQAHMYFTFEKPLQNLFNSLSHTQNVVSLSKLWLFSITLREKGILFYRKQFLTTFKKQLQSS